MVNVIIIGRLGMTIPIEEKRSLLSTRQLLSELNQSNATQIKSNLKDIRARARACLKHYPMEYRINDVWDKEIDAWEQDLAGNISKMFNNNVKENKMKPVVCPKCKAHHYGDVEYCICGIKLKDKVQDTVNIKDCKNVEEFFSQMFKPKENTNEKD